MPVNAWRAQKSGLQLFCALFPPDYPYDPAEPALVRLVLERRCLDADSTPSWQPTYANLLPPTQDGGSYYLQHFFTDTNRGCASQKQFCSIVI